MSTYFIMKFFESTPGLYDRAIRWITLGKLPRIQKASRPIFRPGSHVLDIGCGTGEWSLLAASRGAFVKAIDISPVMLDRARARAHSLGHGKQIQFCEQSLMELDHEPDARYDVIISSLVLSECRPEEQIFALPHIARILKPGGRWVLVDEIRPQGTFLAVLIRGFRMMVLWFFRLLGVSVSRPLNLNRTTLTEQGFRIELWQVLNAGTLLFCIARKEKR